MFIKVHDKGQESYINTDNIAVICESVDTNFGKTALLISGTEGWYYVDESKEDIMKIIGYFKVADDKWKLSENGDPTLDTPVAFFNTKGK